VSLSYTKTSAESINQSSNKTHLYGDNERHTVAETKPSVTFAVNTDFGAKICTNAENRSSCCED